jgi:type IV secretory pathway TrbF-like protein
MRHPLVRTAVRYDKAPLPVTPYQKAAQVWDERIGAARVQARNWRWAAFAALAVSIGLSLAMMLGIGRIGLVPYVIEVDRLGEVRSVGPAAQAYQPSDATIAHFIAKMVENIRSLSIDPVVVRSNWLSAYDFVTDRGAQMLNAYAKDADPFGRIGTRTVMVDVTSVVRASNESFEVRWRESTYENGSLADIQRFTGVITIILKAPTEADAIRRNPLGLYVHAFNWSRDLIGDMK